MSDRKFETYPTYLGMMFLALLFLGGSLQAGDVVDVEAPRLLDEKALLNVSELALSLSARRDWLHPAILDELSHRAMRLDEIFVDAPSRLLIEGRPHRLMIGPLDRRWQEVDRDKVFSVFLTADIYQLAKGQLLGFQNGKQTLLWPADLNTLPALGISLHGPLVEERLPDGFLLEFGKATRLGSVHSRVRRELAGAAEESGTPPLKSGCPSWQRSDPPGVGYVPKIAGYSPGTGCSAVFGQNSICAEFTLCNGFVTQSCCIPDYDEGSNDPTICDGEVVYMRDPGTPEE